MRVCACVILGAILSSLGSAQPAGNPPAFDIADVHLSPHTANPFMSGGILRGGRYVLRKATMVDLIRTAYDIDADNVVGGPAWLESDRFDVTAKIPPNTPPETVPLMLQTLLADRFKLVVHNDTKPMQAFVLSVAKGGKPKLREAAEGSGNNGCQPGGPPEPGSVPLIRLSCHNMTMAALATSLHQMAGGYITDPVVDSTGIKGSWDFDLSWTPRGALQAAGGDGISIFQAVERLGLKLDAQKVPMPVIRVDSANQKPTGNPPGLTESMPAPPPAEFEVADIKPSPPGAPARGGGFMPGGRIDVRGVPLKMLIALAWDLSPLDDIAGAPKFVNTATFDLVAKASTATQTAANNGPPIDIDDLRLMMRALLADRFKLKTHYEDQPVTAYTLLAVKPKLKKADPSNRTGCKVGPAPAGKDSADSGPPAFQAACQNMTMAQFAERLTTIAPLYIHNPVVDSTGLEGAWDFTVSFSPVPAGFAGGGGRNGGLRVPEGGGGTRPDAGSSPVPSASEPSDTMNLFDAIGRQLGLKLEAQKRPLPVLVIDHVEEKPTDN